MAHTWDSATARRKQHQRPHGAAAGMMARRHCEASCGSTNTRKGPYDGRNLNYAMGLKGTSRLAHTDW